MRKTMLAVMMVALGCAALAGGCSSASDEDCLGLAQAFRCAGIQTGEWNYETGCTDQSRSMGDIETLLRADSGYEFVRCWKR